jgi:pantothenate kinase
VQVLYVSVERLQQDESLEHQGGGGGGGGELQGMLLLALNLAAPHFHLPRARIAH